MLGATLGFMVGSLLHDFLPAVDPDEWARQGGFFGGLAGLVALAQRA